MARPVRIRLVVPGSTVVFSMLEISIPAAPEVLLMGRVAFVCSLLNLAVEVKQVSVSRRTGDDIFVVNSVVVVSEHSSAVVSSKYIFWADEAGWTGI